MEGVYAAVQLCLIPIALRYTLIGSERKPRSVNSSAGVPWSLMCFLRHAMVLRAVLRVTGKASAHREKGSIMVRR